MRLGKSQREKDVTKVVSVAAIRDGKLLMGLRGDSGKWNLPGGHVEPGEDIRQAARRELYEETGLKADRWEHIGFCDVRDGLRVYSFICQVLGDDEAKADQDPDEEMAAFKWLDIHHGELPSSIMRNLHNKQDVTLQFMSLQERTLELIWDDDWRDIGVIRELEKLHKMAIKDLRPGKKLPVDRTLWPEDRYPTYDYTHLLPPVTRRAGYKLTLHQPRDGDFDRGMPRVVVTKGKGDDNFVGEVSTKDWPREPTTIAIDDAHVGEEHRGKGIGMAAYEALLVHAKKLGYTHIAGGLHSSSASAVHQKLADKHGMAYKQVENRLGGLDPRLGAKATGEYDQQFGPYRYAIKSELGEDFEPLEKMGAMARLAPFNPQDPSVNKENVHDWAMGWFDDAGNGREALPEMDTNTRFRALHHLHGATTVRRNPQTQEREFLLHRGVRTGEVDLSSNVIQSAQKSSWTPKLDIAQGFGRHRGGTVSAWVPESAISLVPKQLGRVRTFDPISGKDRPGRFEMAPEYEVITHPGSFPIHSFAKAEDLNKGAMARIAPFNPAKPEHRLDPMAESTLARWQSEDHESEDRDATPSMDPNPRLRALHRLAANTFVRTNVKGEREYLLHRGMSQEEMDKVRQPNGTINHDIASSWTPRYNTAKNFASTTDADGRHFVIANAWVPESSIRIVPKQYGALDRYADMPDDERPDDPEDKPGLGVNCYNREHEVIVDPDHNSAIAQPHEVEAKTRPLTTLHGRINEAGNQREKWGEYYHRSNLAPQLLRERFQHVKKFEDELGVWLVKATRPQDFKAIARAVTNEGPRFVDHKSQMMSHPPEHNPVVAHYNQEVLSSGRVYKPLRGKRGDGITRKVIFQTQKAPPAVQAKLFPDNEGELIPNSGMDAKFMVKPYHEGIPRRIQSWQQYPIQGWAEMANQALYHAGGIGHLHQKVHVSEHNMGAGHENEPALVVHMEPGTNSLWQERHAALAPDKKAQLQHDALRIGLMDFLTNNLDRHHGNLLVRTAPIKDSPTQAKEIQQLMAIDHSRSFQYVNNHHHKWDPRAKVRRIAGMEDSLKPYLTGKSTTSVSSFFQKPQTHEEQQQFLLDHGRPLFDWWAKAGPAIRSAMHAQLSHIKDPEARAHIARNFFTRADWLDERAGMGIENYGTDWLNDPVIQYHPHEKTEDELEDERNAAARAEWEREQKERESQP